MIDSKTTPTPFTSTPSDVQAASSFSTTGAADMKTMWLFSECPRHIASKVASDGLISATTIWLSKRKRGVF